jgi:hypothetical protein
MSRPILIEIGAGELIDRITILRIKSQRIKDESKLEYINRELKDLDHCRCQSLKPSDTLAKLEFELLDVNLILWRIEEKLRIHEDQKSFGDNFIELARYVYTYNDRRSKIKQEINQLVNSRVVEQKSY